MSEENRSSLVFTTTQPPSSNASNLGLPRRWSHNGSMRTSGTGKSGWPCQQLFQQIDGSLMTTDLHIDLCELGFTGKPDPVIGVILPQHPAL